MTALLDTQVPAVVTPDVPLPEVFRAELNGFDEPVHGMLREIFPRTARAGRPNPVQLLPGDYVLDGDEGSAVWLRVGFVKHGATGSRVHCCSGWSFFVPAGRQVWVWPAGDVLVWAVLGESAGGAR